MRRAIAIAEASKAAGNNDPYAAVIADPVTNTILAEGCNHASHNPIWHGEMSAITNLSKVTEQPVYDIAPKLELYTTAEPCPMCMGAIEWAGFAAVFYGTNIPFLLNQNRSQLLLRAADLASTAKGMRAVPVYGGVLEKETNALYTRPNQDSFETDGRGAVHDVRAHMHDGGKQAELRSRLRALVDSLRTPTALPL